MTKLSNDVSRAYDAANEALLSEKITRHQHSLILCAISDWAENECRNRAWKGTNSNEMDAR